MAKKIPTMKIAKAVPKMKVNPMVMPKKMSADQVAARKKKAVANAAGKLMGGLYSK